MPKKSRRSIRNPERLKPRSKDGVHVVIETPKRSRNKFKWDDGLGAYRLAKVLPAGMSFPFDFGFVPRTRAEDGDAIDVLVLMDEPVFPGCVVPCRLVGVIEAEQTERDGHAERNDRLIAVAESSTIHEDVNDVADLSRNLLSEIEEFFCNYNMQAGKKFKVLGRRGPEVAGKLLRQSEQNFKRAA